MSRSTSSIDPGSADDADQPWNQGVSIEAIEAARASFLEGNRLFRIPLHAKAADQYLAAIARWKHPAFYFNLAIAQLNLGQDVEAYASLQQALRFGEAPLGADQFLEAQRQLDALKRVLGRIQISCATGGAEVALDGVTLFIGPGSFQGWVKATSHELTAKKAGYLSEARRVAVVAGQLQDIELKLVTLSQATDASRRWAVWKPWAVVAAGGALAVVGGGLHALAARSFSDFDQQVSKLPCAIASADDPRVGCSRADIGPRRASQLQGADRNQAMAVGAYIAGGALLATGVVLLYMNRPRVTERASARVAARRVIITPVASAAMVGLQWSLRR